jgi:1-acyl-sn-glycerol-3-phosphate acyltransferase
MDPCVRHTRKIFDSQNQRFEEIQTTLSGLQMSRFISPAQSPHLISFLKLLLPAVMRFKRNIVQLHVTPDGLDRFHQLNGQRTVICPNHPDPADGETLFGLSRLVREEFYYLAAREIFRSNHGWNEILLRHAGCYSVRRGTADYESYKTTRDLIVEGKHKLVIFPEAEISHRGDLLLPIEPGVAQMSFWALDRLHKMGQPAPVYILPLAIKYTYQKDIRPALEGALRRLEGHLGLTAEKSSLIHRVKNVIETLLATLESTYAFEEQPLPCLADRLFRLRNNILKRVADYLGVLLPPADSQTKWARILGGVLHELRFEADPEPFGYYHRIHAEKLDKAKCCIRDLRRVINFLLFDASLDGPLGQEDVAEVIAGIESEVFRTSRNYGPRQVFIEISAPIDLEQSYEKYKSNKVLTINEINERLTGELAAMIQRLDREHTKIWIKEPGEVRGDVRAVS